MSDPDSFYTDCIKLTLHTVSIHKFMMTSITSPTK